MSKQVKVGIVSLLFFFSLSSFSEGTRSEEEKCWSPKADRLFSMFGLKFDESRQRQIQERYAEIKACLESAGIWESTPGEHVKQVYAIVRTDQWTGWNRFYTRLERSLENLSIPLQFDHEQFGRGETMLRLLAPFYEQMTASENFTPQYPSALQAPFIDFVNSSRSLRAIFPEDARLSEILFVSLDGISERPPNAVTQAGKNLLHARGGMFISLCVAAVVGAVVTANLHHKYEPPPVRSQIRHEEKIVTPPPAPYDPNEELGRGFGE